MTRHRGWRLWCKVAIHGGTIQVYATKQDLTDGEGPVDAYCDLDAGEIVVRYSDNVSIMYMRLHHELLHACFAAHSGDAKDRLFGSTPDTRAEREEALVSFLEPVQFDLLVRNGFLKYPKPPKLP
jgi:hypothetical protein